MAVPAQVGLEVGVSGARVVSPIGAAWRGHFLNPPLIPNSAGNLEGFVMRNGYPGIILQFSTNLKQGPGGLAFICSFGEMLFGRASEIISIIESPGSIAARDGRIAALANAVVTQAAGSRLPSPRWAVWTLQPPSGGRHRVSGLEYNTSYQSVIGKRLRYFDGEPSASVIFVGISTFTHFGQSMLG